MFVLDAKLPDRSPPKGSLFPVDAAGGFGDARWVAADGVKGREFGAEVPAEESIEKTSC